MLNLLASAARLSKESAQLLVRKDSTICDGPTKHRKSLPLQHESNQEADFLAIATVY